MRLLGLGLAVPDGVVSQRDAASIAASLVAGNARRVRLVDALFERSGVTQRHSAIVDQAGAQTFYPPADELASGPSTSARMLAYEAAAGEFAVDAARDALTESGVEAAACTHLLTVSCTGFSAPGFDLELVHSLGLDARIRRAHVGFMGCHGLFNALALAASICAAQPAARVLLCSVELCTLHFSYAWESEKLVANALFGDGAAAMVVGANGAARLRVAAQASWVLPETGEAMSWSVRDHGFEMTLGSEVPALIRAGVGSRIGDWLAECGTSPDDIRHWAVHPGGPRILDAVRDALELPESAMEPSRAILAAYGNMSSATVAFVIGRIRETLSGPCVALGLGPGLTLEAMLLEPTP